MAEEVRKCLSRTQYGGKPTLVPRGISKEEKFIFKDEDHLVLFLRKSERSRDEHSVRYRPSDIDLWNKVAIIWDLDYNFSGSYRDVYYAIQMSDDGEKTCWADKYSMTVIRI